MAMKNRAERQPVPVMLLSFGFVTLWLIAAAFPFLWTFWGSFKVEADFFSFADWTSALTGTKTIQQTGSAFTSNGYQGAWVEQPF